jgi:exonuclease III
LTKGKLQELLDKEDPDILCLLEIKTYDDKLKELSIKDCIPRRYKQYWNCCQVKNGICGTAIFTKVAPLEVKND